MFHWIFWIVVLYWTFRLRREIFKFLYNYYLVFDHILFTVHYDKYTSKIITKEQYEQICKYANISYDYIFFLMREHFINELECGKLTECAGNNVILTYYKTDVKYKLIIPKGKRGPKDIQAFFNEDETRDLTENIRPYLGPYGNFHGIQTTPKMLGFDFPIIVKYSQGRRKYMENEIISVML